LPAEIERGIMLNKLVVLAMLVAVVLVCGACNSAGDGSLGAIRVEPATATASASAETPDNQVRFVAWPEWNGGFHPTSNLGNVDWASSDPVNAPISNVRDVTHGVATCLHVGTGPVTITATAPKESGSSEIITGTAMLTCN
jgi:hypothetical protein